uniref:BMA-CPG-4 n=2 Tax=Brugia malayi TaxID=6279 RepID=A0A0H5S9M5_BRUMA|nr:BMA-CPG-4 [Brugia malayi]
MWKTCLKIIQYLLLYFLITISDMKGLRLDDISSQREQSNTLTTIAEQSKDLLNQQMEQLKRTLNNTTSAPKSIMSQIARCLRCTKPFLLAIRAALVSGNHFERFVNVCNRLRGVLQCTSHVPGKCSKEKGIESLLNSFRYFCIDQFLAYKYIFECLDLHSAAVLRECQQRCQATRQVLGWFLYSYIHSTLPFSVPESDVPAKINVKYFNKISSDACSALSCYMQCLREKYNRRCSDIGGNMLLEVLFRPLVSLHKSWAYSPIATSMMLIMPQTCNFLTNLNQLNNYRLDGKTYAKINNAFPKSAINQYANHLQGSNSSATLWMPLLKNIPSPLDHTEFSSNPIKVSTPTIHIEEIEEAIEELKAIDKLQQLKL